jgi:hypothetical protein
MEAFFNANCGGRSAMRLVAYNGMAANGRSGHSVRLAREWLIMGGFGHSA